LVRISGLTPKKYQSGETDVTGRISKGSTLKSWGMRLAARAGMRKAKVGPARKLAVVLHRMLVDGTTFLAEKAAVAAAR
jgi:transposase